MKIVNESYVQTNVNMDVVTWEAEDDIDSNKPNENNLEILSKIESIISWAQESVWWWVTVAKDVKFDWKWSSSNSINMTGSSVKMMLKFDEVDKIHDYLISEGFSIDPNNMADWTVESLSWYIKSNMVCLLNIQSLVQWEELPNENTINDTYLICWVLKVVPSNKKSTVPTTNINMDIKIKEPTNKYIAHSAWLSFEYPQSWYTKDNEWMIYIQNVEWDFDKFSRPTNLKLFWIDYNPEKRWIDAVKEIERKLIEWDFQYSSSELIKVKNDNINIRLYLFFDVDCWKSAKAFWDYNDKIFYASHWRSCWEQIKDSELDIFKSILSSIILN